MIRALILFAFAILVLGNAHTNPFSLYLERLTRPDPVVAQMISRELARPVATHHWYTPLVPMNMDHCLVSMDDVKLGSSLGAGYYSDVFEAEHCITKMCFAVKCLQYHEEEGIESPFHTIRREEYALNMICFPQLIVKHYCTLMDINKEAVFLMLEKINGINLLQILKKGPILMPTLREWTASLVIAIHALHLQGLTHSDLKEGNIMIDHRGRVKLIDFGLTRKSNSCEPGKGVPLGAVLYWPPEYFPMGPNKCYSDPRADWWALGVILARVLGGKNPWDLSQLKGIDDRVEKNNAFGQLVQQGFTLPKALYEGDSDKKALVDFIYKLTALNLHDRIGSDETTVIELCESHPWLAPLGPLSDFLQNYILS